MTIQQACDKLTELCHQGHAQARLMFISGTDVKEVGNIEMLGDDTALVRSQIKWPEPPKPKKTVEACKICDNNHAYCKYGNNCSMRGRSMTREEITKEAQEQVNYCTPLHPEDFIHGYIAGAEPREKRIVELEKDKAYTEEQLDEQIQATLKLQKENKDLADCNSRLLSQAAAATKRLVALEQENNKLLDVINNQDVKIADLEKKNAKLKDRLAETNLNGNIVLRELTKAKELIENIIRVTWGEGWNYSLDWKVKAEQFLKEIEK